MVPVQVGQQERAAECPAAQHERQLLQSGARIQHDCGRLTGVGEPHA